MEEDMLLYGHLIIKAFVSYNKEDISWKRQQMKYKKKEKKK